MEVVVSGELRVCSVIRGLDSLVERRVYLYGFGQRTVPHYYLLLVGYEALRLHDCNPFDFAQSLHQPHLGGKAHLLPRLVRGKVAHLNADLSADAWKLTGFCACRPCGSTATSLEQACIKGCEDGVKSDPEADPALPGAPSLTRDGHFHTLCWP